MHPAFSLVVCREHIVDSVDTGFGYITSRALCSSGMWGRNNASLWKWLNVHKRDYHTHFQNTVCGNLHCFLSRYYHGGQIHLILKIGVLTYDSCFNKKGIPWFLFSFRVDSKLKH